MTRHRKSSRAFNTSSDSPAIRHIAVVAVAVVIVLAFAAVHGQWSPMHRWNRAFGDASLVLVALSMGIGPLARLVRPTVRLLRFRRELGIYGCLMAIVHITIILVGWVQWDLMRFFCFEWHPQLQGYVMVQQGFGLANGIGLAAVFLACILALTSNDLSQRRLGASAWKFLQMGVLPLWWLTVAHVAYFLFLHFMSFHRETPAPNPLQIWFVGLVIVVLGLRSSAYLRTARAKQAAPKSEKGVDHAAV